MEKNEELTYALQHIKENKLAYLSLLFDMQEAYLFADDNGTMTEERKEEYRAQMGNFKAIIQAS